MAYSLTLGSARRALSAAPLPRPPEPTRPTLRVSPPAAWTAGATLSTAAEAPIAAEVLRKARREELRRLKGNSCGGGGGGVFPPLLEVAWTPHPVKKSIDRLPPPSLS